MNEAKDLFLTPNEIAEKIDVTPTVVRLWIRQGKLPAEKFGRQWLVSRNDANSFICDYQKWAKTTGK